MSNRDNTLYGLCSLYGLCGCLVLALTACAPGGGDSCTADAGAAASADERFDSLFTRSGDGWTGGGEAQSVALPDGRTVWLFGQSFLGIVHPDRSRPLGSPRVQNTFVVQDGDELSTLHLGSAREPRALLSPPEAGLWYAPLEGIVLGDRLHVFLAALTQAPDGTVVRLRNDVATFTLPGLMRLSTDTVSDDPVVSFGVSLVEADGFVYVYGVEEMGSSDKFMHVARAPSDAILGPWQYYDGRGWDDDPASSARVLRGVASQYSVLRRGERFVLLAQRTGFGRDIVVRDAATPAGPWSAATTVFCTPETPGLSTYNAIAHPQFDDSDGRLLLSYMVNNERVDGAFDDADTFRPRFVRVFLP